MKLFSLALIVYVVALALLVVEGRGGGTTKGLDDSVRLFVRARRHAPEGLIGLWNNFDLANNEKPPPPPPARIARSVNQLDFIEMSNDHSDSPPLAVQHRARRQMPPPPPPPEGMPAPPEGMPPPPQPLA